MATSSKPSLLKSSFWYVVSGFLSKSVVLFMMPIYVRLLSKGQYGDYSNFTSWLSVFSSTALMNLQFLIIRDTGDDSQKNDQLFWNVFYAILLVSLPLVIPMALAPQLAGRLLLLTPGQVYLLVLYLTLVPLFQLATARMRAQLSVRSFVIANLSVTFAAASLSMVLMVFFPTHRLEAFILGQTAPFIAASLLLAAPRLGALIAPRWEALKPILSIGLPMIPHILGITIINRINRVMVYNMLGAEAAGDFALVANLLLILTTLSTALVQAYTPWLTRRLREEQLSLIGLVSGAQIGVFLYFIAGLAVLAPELLLFWGGRAYANALPLLPPLLASALFTHMQTLLVNVEFFYESKHTLVYSTFLAAAVNILLNLWVLPRWGTIGASYTSLVSTLLLYALHDRAVRSLGKAQVIAPLAAYGGSILILLLTVLLPFIYRHSTLRYSLVCLGLIATLLATFVAFHYRQKIAQALSRITKP